MRILSSPEELQNTFINLIKKYQHIRFAVAWASTRHNVFLELIKEDNKKKIIKSIVGLHFYQTDAEFIREFLNDEQVKFIKKSKGIFHPKIYLFYNTRSEWKALIGSANFTQSALFDNYEVMVEFHADDSFEFQKLEKLLDQYYEESDMMSNDKLNEYIRESEKNQKLKSQIKDNFIMNKFIKDMTWKEYYLELQKNGHTLKERLDVLIKVNQYFHNDFTSLTELQRKNIAGIIKNGDGISNWYIFGHMPVPYFSSRVSDEDKNGEKGPIKSYMKISEALKYIPSSGEVSKEDFDKCMIYFIEYAGWGYSISTVSRLLAMKRPDQFFCVTGIKEPDKKGNYKELKNNFMIENKIETYDDYWASVVENVRKTAWYKSIEPTDKMELQLWQGRVALMDALFNRTLQ